MNEHWKQASKLLFENSVFTEKYPATQSIQECADFRALLEAEVNALMCIIEEDE